MQLILSLIFFILISFMSPILADQQQNPEPILSVELYEQFAKRLVNKIKSGNHNYFIKSVNGDGLFQRAFKDFQFDDDEEQKAFIKKIKNLGYFVKLDTNGYHPEILEKLIKSELLDYVAMDIKGTWRKYEKIVNIKMEVENIKKSVSLLKTGQVPYEFRSTVLPAFHTEKDIVSMARQIKGADKYYLQQFRPAQSLVDPDFLGEITYTKKQLAQIVEEFKSWFKVCKVR